MEIYLVGGAVRDKILNRTNTDKDYVVVGSSYEEMLNLGFISIGKFFPVFIHKEKDGEFALARTEKRVGKKHFDFECFTKDVSLKDDLRRRDLSINALAYDEENDKIIDFYGGLDDIKNKILRPVSNAFCEDALRILRAARFRSELGSDWIFDKKLFLYAQQIKKDLKYISRERVYEETKKALKSPKPSLFFRSLYELNVLDVIFPWLFNLTKIKHNDKYHLENSNFEHAMFAIDLCKNDEIATWCTLFYDAIKYISYMQDVNFCESNKSNLINQAFLQISKTLTLSKIEMEISKFFALYYSDFKKIYENSIELSKIATLLFKMKNENKLNSLLIACEAIMNGQINNQCKLFFTKNEIISMYKLLKSAKYSVNHETMKSEQIKSIIKHEQIKILQDFIDTLSKSTCKNKKNSKNTLDKNS